MEILFALTGMNRNNFDCLLLSIIDDIKLKNSDPKKGILTYYFEGVEFVRQFTKYEDLYEFIKKHEDSLKKQKATTFATLDVLNHNLEQIYDSLENFLNAYHNNIPNTFSIQFSLTNNVYNLVMLETILSTFDGNKINLYLQRFKNTPLTDTLISLYIKETKLPRIDLTKYNIQSSIIQSKQIQSNNNTENIFANAQKLQNNPVNKQENKTNISLQEIKDLLTEFKQEILKSLNTSNNKQNLNKYQLSLIELIEQSYINEQNYQLIYNTIKTILNNTNSQNNKTEESDNIFDNIEGLSLNDIV